MPISDAPADGDSRNRLIARCWLEPDFELRLLGDPAGVLREEGFPIPPGQTVEIVRDPVEGDDSERFYLPRRPPSLGTDVVGDELRALRTGAGLDLAPASPVGDSPGPGRLRLPAHLSVWLDGEVDPEGGDALYFASHRRRVKLDGPGARVFYEQVVPLLDGSHSVDAIERAVANRFGSADLSKTLGVLARESLLEDAEGPVEGAREPQRRFFDELGADGRDVQRRLRESTVAIVGLGLGGPSAALALAAAGVGTIRCIDSLRVEPTDPFLAVGYPASSVGRLRVEAVAEMVARIAPETTVVAKADPLDDDASVLAAIDRADFVICAVDASLASLVYRINRACLASRTKWTSASMEGLEAVIGPTVDPYASPCYVCYQMRAAACAEHPQDAVSYQSYLDARKRDDSGRRENLAPGAGAVGNLLALEAIKVLSHAISPSAQGNILVLDFLNATSTLHAVLREPRCPACRPADGRSSGLAVETRSGTPLYDYSPLVSSRVGLIRSLRPLQTGARHPSPPVLYETQLADVDFAGDVPHRPRTGIGKGVDADSAVAAAIGEAVERYCASQVDEEAMLVASAAELDGGRLSPTELVLYSERQHSSGSIPFAPFDPHQELHWLPGRSPLGGEELWVPAQFAYLNYRRELASETLCFHTSNGLAAGPTTSAAVLGGLCELIERDALMVMWLNRLGVPEVDIRSLAGLPGEYSAHYAKRDVAVRVFNLTTDVDVYVMLGVAVDRSGQGPAAVIGLGCSLDPGQAIVKALLELYQGQVGQDWKFHNMPVEQRVRAAEDVRQFADHASLFANVDLLDQLDFFLEAAPVQALADLPSHATGHVDGDLQALAAMLAGVGSRVAYVDLTTPDVAPLGIKVVRSLASELQPIHCGHRHERLGGRRVYEVPARLGYRSADSQETDLNPCPHPLP